MDTYLGIKHRFPPASKKVGMQNVRAQLNQLKESLATANDNENGPEVFYRKQMKINLLVLNSIEELLSYIGDDKT